MFGHAGTPEHDVKFMQPHVIPNGLPENLDDPLGPVFRQHAAASKLKQIGIVAITVTLVLTMLVLYLNRRSGGKLLDGVFGN